MKPYRLISSQEHSKIQLHINEVFEQWNDRYSLMQLNAELIPLPKHYSINKPHVIHQTQQPLALVERHYLSLINQSLFGEDKPCFNPSSEDLFLILIKNLFKTEANSLCNNLAPIPNWFYPGSTSLLLTMSLTGTECTLVINPDWVYQQLAPTNTSKDSLCPVDDALAAHNLLLNIDLLPVKLNVQQILDLQIGDVLATDHPISEPLRLMQKNQMIAPAELGQSTDFKSIKL